MNTLDQISRYQDHLDTIRAFIADRPGLPDAYVDIPRQTGADRVTLSFHGLCKTPKMVELLGAILGMDGWHRKDVGDAYSWQKTLDGVDICLYAVEPHEPLRCAFSAVPKEAFAC